MYGTKGSINHSLFSLTCMSMHVCNARNGDTAVHEHPQFHLLLSLVAQKTTRTMQMGIQKVSVPEPNLAGNGREDNPLSSLAIHRINGKLHLFYHFSSGLHQVIRI